MTYTSTLEFVCNSGFVSGRIVPFSPAERCNKLFLGDRILAVNGVDIKSLHHGNIVHLIKLSGYSVTLTIGAPRGEADRTQAHSLLRSHNFCFTTLDPSNYLKYIFVIVFKLDNTMSFVNEHH